MFAFKVLRNVFIGFGVAAISILIFSLIADQLGVESILISELKRQVIGSMLFGGFCGIIAFIYDMEKISMFVKTSIHLFLLSSGYVFTGKILGWFSSEAVFYSFGIFAVIYIMVWGTLYVYNKNLVLQLNTARKN